jgi:programmed cell death protein 4
MDPDSYAEIPIDEKDPLYDEAEDSTKYILSSIDQGAEKSGYDPGTSKAVYGPMLTLSEFKVQLRECLNEYFDSCDADEVIRTLEELGCKEYHPEIVKKAISLSMDKGPRERELTSRLLTCLHPTPLSMEGMEEGFEKLLDSLEDLSTDVPDATTMVASFLARAVVDEVLPPAFMSEQNNARPGDPVIEKAVGLLSREHCTARLERIWGPGDGRPVEELKKDMDQLLQEYLLSRELDEAARCVRELGAPHFHHELVKRGVFAAMEEDGKSRSKDDANSNIDAMAALIAFLVRNAIVSEYQVKKGIGRLHQILPDLLLDVPAAGSLLATFEKLAKEQGCLPKSSGGSSASVAEEAK